MSDDFSKKVQSSSPEEAKELVIQSLAPECRGVGKNFFNCVESKILQLSSNQNIAYNEIEQKMMNTYVPECMSKFNLEECLSKYESNL